MSISQLPQKIHAIPIANLHPQTVKGLNVKIKLWHLLILVKLSLCYIEEMVIDLLIDGQTTCKLVKWCPGLLHASNHRPSVFIPSQVMIINTVLPNFSCHSCQPSCSPSFILSSGTKWKGYTQAKSCWLAN